MIIITQKEIFVFSVPNPVQSFVLFLSANCHLKMTDWSIGDQTQNVCHEMDIIGK